MDAAIFRILMEGEMAKEAGVGRFIKKVLGKNDAPLSPGRYLNAQALDNQGDHWGVMTDGKMRMFRTGDSPSEIPEIGGIDRGLSDISLNAKSVVKGGPGRESAARHGDWADVEAFGDQLDDAGRFGPIRYTAPLPKGDTAGWPSQVADEIESFAQSIGRTMSPERKQKALSAAQAVLDDRNRSSRNQFLGAAGLGVAGLAGAGVVARKAMKSRTAQKALKRNLAIGGGAAALGTGATGAALFHRDTSS